MWKRKRRQPYNFGEKKINIRASKSSHNCAGIQVSLKENIIFTAKFMCLFYIPRLSPYIFNDAFSELLSNIHIAVEWGDVGPRQWRKSLFQEY